MKPEIPLRKQRQLLNTIIRQLNPIIFKDMKPFNSLNALHEISRIDILLFLVRVYLVFGKTGQRNSVLSQQL
jgi:hypothetical protein